MSQTATTSSTMMYLDYDDWSPRYDAACFYTMQLSGYVWTTSPEQLHDVTRPHNRDDDEQERFPSVGRDSHPSFKMSVGMPRNGRLPTYYYKIIVYRGHHQHVLYRSYIQFEWLYQQLRMTMSEEKHIESNTAVEPMRIPHPLQGNSDQTTCNFLGYCWVVQQMQEWLDLIAQHHYRQQQQHQQQEQKASTMMSTTDEPLLSNRNHHQPYNSTFAEKRCQQLSYFLSTTLVQYGRSSSTPSITNAKQSAVIRQFLEL